MNKQWWGYLHTSGNIQVKPVMWGIDETMRDASHSPFVEKLYGPFDATGREEAINIIKEKIEHEKENN